MEYESDLVNLGGLTELSSVFTLALYYSVWGRGVGEEERSGRQRSDNFPPKIHNFPAKWTVSGESGWQAEECRGFPSPLYSFWLVSRQKGLKEELVDRCGGRYV